MKKIFFIIVILIIVVACERQNFEVLLEESGSDIKVHFCPQDDCEEALISHITRARFSVHCAFFDLDLKKLINLLDKKSKNIDVKLVLDSDNYFKQTKDVPIVLDDKNQLSHNKFCVIDNNLVATGSFNPTENGNNKNNNNLITINSRFLAENYEDEFQELWKKEFGTGKKVKYPEIVYNYRSIKNYFCPEDNCAQHLIKEIMDAKHTIYFMTFSFTDENVADAILYSNVSDIKGIFEKFQAGGKYSQYNRLKEYGLNVNTDNNPKMMHHKTL
jgi:hypothetical protein